MDTWKGKLALVLEPTDAVDRPVENVDFNPQEVRCWTQRAHIVRHTIDGKLHANVHDLPKNFQPILKRKLGWEEHTCTHCSKTRPNPLATRRVLRTSGKEDLRRQEGIIVPTKTRCLRKHCEDCPDSSGRTEVVQYFRSASGAKRDEDDRDLCLSDPIRRGRLTEIS